MNSVEIKQLKKQFKATNRLTRWNTIWMASIRLNEIPIKALLCLQDKCKTSLLKTSLE
jgi:hypothetical protein